jgi:hypothetical protein
VDFLIVSPIQAARVGLCVLIEWIFTGPLFWLRGRCESPEAVFFYPCLTLKNAMPSCSTKM